MNAAAQPLQQVDVTLMWQCCCSTSDTIGVAAALGPPFCSAIVLHCNFCTLSSMIRGLHLMPDCHWARGAQLGLMVMLLLTIEL
jgi:hypothetical protein